MGTEPGALSLIEQAVNQLRRNNSAALSEYYIGTLPFVLALLYFWSDMSRNSMAGWYCGPAAAGLALLFIWMKMWQVRFCRRLWCRLEKAEPEKWTLGRTVVTAARQSAVHATGVVILPLAFIFAVPLGWVYAFYQNICVVDDHRTNNMSQLAKAAKVQAALWPGQNHLILTLMTLFGIFVFFNLGAWLLAMPYLLKSVLGVETVFTLSGMGLLNTTFLAVLCGLTYLCIDPILKAVYVHRCFYGCALRTGADLKSALRPFVNSGLLVLMFFMVSLTNAVADNGGNIAKDPWKAVVHGRSYVEQLDGHLDSVLEQRRFAWRLPRQDAPDSTEKGGWMTATLKWIEDKFKDLFTIIGGGIEDFFDWLIKKIPFPKFSKSSESGDYRQMVLWIFYAVGFGLALWLVIWLIRWLKHSRPVQTGVDEGKASTYEIDLADETITAEDLPLERWLAMAEEMMERKEFRRAIRALYLSVLANLADHRRVKIARYKSNRDYAVELTRRAHAEPELLKSFDWCIGVFERAWYGMHPVGKRVMDQFVDHQKRIADLVQPAA
jgi:hypothetical protein